MDFCTRLEHKVYTSPFALPSDRRLRQLKLSARGYHRILKLARTIADKAGCEEIQSVHLAEALHGAQPAEVDVERRCGKYLI